MDEVLISWLIPVGRGGGKHGDDIVRVAGTIPGDRVLFTEERRRKRRVDGALQQIVEASPDRISPTCPYSADCGGCDLDHIEGDARRRHIGAMAAQILHLDAPIRVVGPRAETGQRARVTLHLADGELGYRRARSHDLVPVADCEVARPEIRQGITRLREWLATHDSAGITDVEIRSDGTRAVFAIASDGPMTSTEHLHELIDVAVNGRRVCGEPVLQLSVHGCTLQASPGSFFQVNLELNQHLVAHVVEGLRRRSATRVLDLYAGNGNFSIPIATAGMNVVAVEFAGSSVEDLACKVGSLPIEILRMRAERFDPSLHVFDAVVIDPPRTGAVGVLAAVRKNRPNTIIYVSCHLPSAVRDLRELPDYTIHETVCFDLFPRTHHFETVLVLHRD